jgi:hypothetical protein
VLDGWGIGFALGVTFLTVFHISFLALLTHFTGVFPERALAPTFGQAVPGRWETAEAMARGERVNTTVISPIPAIERRMRRTLAPPEWQH